MGLFEAIKGLFSGDGLSGDGLSGLLESTGLGEHVEGLLGEGSAIAENLGLDLGHAGEALGLDGLTESLPGSLGDAVSGLTDGLADTPAA